MIKEIILIILVVAIFSGMGYAIGFQDGVKLAISYGLKFVDVDVDQQMIETALFQYKNNIGGCLFTNGTSVLHE